MGTYVLTPRARSDVAEIWDYTEATWGRSQAETYIRDLQRVIESAAEHPRLGRASDDIRAGYFRRTAGSHVVFYRLNAEGVEVVRILHQSMDFDRNL
ncbi:MAG: type II toxin-antitoxin system RelE/ParE family toxin [Phenylobacterium sp.]|uniref:type II toxin-antitoxin system RelE/ParE family toxin n=1 Tax=Phenylobacterium sp. TaxID=1871053 RepID=UPI0027361402|nr:type II toxin-antitoxin system RelE/ParE family toxin [Phenylobacterium sp.]MDP3174167.1 type II toxin-antitoxin system RelE/ParE family toxin [Phenylobacterium sp.]